MRPQRPSHLDLPTLLNSVRRRPEMYLGEKGIRLLGLFLFGIDYAENYHDVPEGSRIRGFDFAAFEKWVESKYNLSRLMLNSMSLAAHLAESDSAGFDLWFRWYDEYRDLVHHP